MRAGLAGAIEEALRDVRTDDPSSAEVASARIASLFEDLPLADDLAEKILAAYRALGEPPVAVRSSATTEDLPGASFAGQQESFLNVRGGDELLEAVRRCWASLSARAIAYRERQGFDHDRVAMASSGPANRPRGGLRHPVYRQPRERRAGRDRHQRRLASGRLSSEGLPPRTTPLDRATLAVRERRTGRQEVETVLADHGTTERPLEPERGRPTHAGRCTSPRGWPRSASR